MYSPAQIHVAAQQPLDASFLERGCLPTDTYDAMRRFSYAELLSNQSEASLSDTEHQTPSPSNDYEEYVSYQQQHQPHPLDDKRRASYPMTDPYTSLNGSFQVPLNGTPVSQMYGYAPVTANVPGSLAMDSTHWLMRQAQVPTSYGSVNPMLNGYPSMYSSCSSMMVDTAALTASPNLLMPVHEPSSLFRDRASSFCASSRSGSISDASMSASSAPSHANASAVDTATATGKPSVKQTRSRGRRVSSHPGAAGQKMFVCDHDDCGKVFKRSEHLKRHVRSIHTLEKPFECPYQSCSKRFSRSDNLNQHIRIHRHTHKEKPASTAATLSSSSSTSTTSSSGPLTDSTLSSSSSSSSLSSSPSPSSSAVTHGNPFNNYMQNYV